VERYLNTPSVRAALNVRADAPYWTDCTNRINYSYQDLLSSVIPVHQALIASGQLRILIFSGDVDGIVPTAGSRAWVESMALKETVSWHPWYSTGGQHFGTQLGGYAVEYEGGFSFATVRGAGHMVPYTQGSRAFDLFSAFLDKKAL
jgi:serine carboxypeptidase-like clade 2